MASSAATYTGPSWASVWTTRTRRGLSPSTASNSGWYVTNAGSTCVAMLISHRPRSDQSSRRRRSVRGGQIEAAHVRRLALGHGLVDDFLHPRLALEQRQREGGEDQHRQETGGDESRRAAGGDKAEVAPDRRAGHEEGERGAL